LIKTYKILCSRPRRLKNIKTIERRNEIIKQVQGRDLSTNNYID